jgi:hypothetical protein
MIRALNQKEARGTRFAKTAIKGFTVGMGLAGLAVSSFGLVMNRIGTLAVAVDVNQLSATDVQLGLFGPVLVSVFGMTMAMARRGTDQQDLLNRLEPALEELDRKIERVMSKITLLDEHSSTYFNLLSDLGWSKLVDIRDAVLSVREDIDTHLADGSYADAFALCEYLLGRGGAFASQLEFITSRCVGKTHNWVLETETLVRTMWVGLKAASDANARIGLRRARGRKMTIRTLSELEALMGRTVVQVRRASAGWDAGAAGAMA